LDFSVISAVKKESHLPVIIDPSHATGVREQILSLSCASAAVNADGLMVEVHNNPAQALSDGLQSLYPEQFAVLMGKIDSIHAIMGS
jgi:3-deoxy-7-phosphoheptulonate synthase